MNRKNRARLEIFVTSSEKLEKKTINMIKSCSGHNITKSLADADILLNIKDNMFVFNALSNSFDFKSSLLKLSKQNLTSSFSLLNGHLFQDTEVKDKLRESVNKSFLKSLKKENKLTKKMHQIEDDELSNLLNHDDLISKTYSDNINISIIPELILTNPLFKNFSTCQLMVHERGHKKVQGYTYDKSSVKSSNVFEVAKFNEVFNLIKKSKNKLFQSDILEGISNIVGTFLAKDLNVEGHNILFVVSRNDFLPHSEEEQIRFQNFCKYLVPILKLCITSQSILSKTDKLKLALNNINRPVVINDKRGETLFSNIQFQNNHNQYDKVFDRVFKAISLSQKATGFIHKYDSFDVTSDIYHFQKVSLLGELLNTLQHELSNPLFGIKLTGDLLKTEVDDEDSLEILDGITQYAGRCQTIIENFSYLYKDELDYQEIDINKVISETAILTKSETRNIRRVISSNNDEILIKTNPTWITQIIFNLIINSSQAIKETTENLSGEYIKVNSELHNSEVVITVEDSGPGIPEHLRQSLFTPFVTTKERGTGLGLSICKNLAGKLNGTLSFENKVDSSGTIFKLSLPLEGEC